MDLEEPDAPDEKKEPRRAVTVRYAISDLQRLKRLQDATRIDDHQWMRVALRALLDSYERQGSIAVPLAVVPKREAIAAGLIPADPDEKPD